MKLADYVEREGRGAIARISRESGVSYTTVHAIARHGQTLSRYDLAKQISDATGGAVTVEDLCEEEAA